MRRVLDVSHNGQRKSTYDISTMFTEETYSEYIVIESAVVHLSASMSATANNHIERNNIYETCFTLVKCMV